MLMFDNFKDENEFIKWWNKITVECYNSYPLKNWKEFDNSFQMKTCVDIGCNVGCFSLTAADYFEKVISFEPAYYTCLTATNIINVQHNKQNVKLYNLAVSNKNFETVKLYSFETNNSGDASLFTKNKEADYDICLTIDLEKVFELCEEKFIDFLKIDCEGAEYDILLNKDLSNIGMIAGEMHEIPEDKDPTGTKKNLLNHIEKNFNLVYNKTNFFAVNKKFNINPKEHWMLEEDNEA